ncbi:MAG: hypothetical protein EOO24_17325 [Comamonadaceae bacterium]|nr:MAG: hypothetical protein EOO24_17325 [Comamonadaceae bacterium]
MVPVEISPWEERQLSLLIQQTGAQPASFTVRKFKADGGFVVRVIARGAATVYQSEGPQDWTSGFARDLEAGVFGQGGSATAPAAIRDALHAIEKALARSGLHGALKLLNARVPHRFTAVYRLEGNLLRSVDTVDKHLHLDPLDLRAVPLKDSFCQFVLRDGLFLTQDSGRDPRLAGHPYGGVMQCYAGVPITRDGAMAGSLCHFDLVNHEVADEDYLLLSHAARLMPAFLGASVIGH